MSTSPSWLRLFTALLLLLLGSWSAAQASGDPSEATDTTPAAVSWEPPFTDTPAALLAKAQALAEDPSWPEDETVHVHVLDQQQEMIFGETGPTTYRSYRLSHVLTRFGSEAQDSVTVEWRPWYQERPEIRARVINPDGSEHWLDTATAADIPLGNDDSGLDETSRLRAPLPALEVGSLIEEEIVVHYHQPYFDAGTSFTFPLALHTPAQRIRIQVEAPAQPPLHVLTERAPKVEPVRQEITDEQGEARVRWTFERSRVPTRETREPDLPSNEPLHAVARVATGRDWQAVAARYAERVDARLAEPDTVADLASGASEALRDVPDDRRARIDALLAWMHARVRDTGRKLGEASVDPEAPGEVLARRYADSKDKATLLVGLLRAAGIEASVALVRQGPGRDTLPEMPGFSSFDHVLVYVPAEDQWIDPGDPFAKAGHLPFDLQHRLALVADAATRELVRTPGATSADNRQYHETDIYLAMGPGRLSRHATVEGALALETRGIYSRAGIEAVREFVDGSLRRLFGIEGDIEIEFSDFTDLDAPMTQTIEAQGVGAAVTDLTEAYVSIDTMPLYYSLPQWLVRGASGDEDENETRQDDLELREPYQREMSFRLHPAPGYRIAELPENRTETLGGAELSQRFTQREDGILEVRLAFDTGPRHHTAEQVEALYQGLRRELRDPYLHLRFEHVGERHLADGRLQEALAEFRRQAQAEPEQALPLLRISRAYLAAGLGSAARHAALQAVNLEPDLDLAHQNLGLVLQNDTVGRPFVGDWDRQGAEAALRKAKELSPDTMRFRENLAYLLERDASGVPFSGSLDEAIAEYRELHDLGHTETLPRLLWVLLRAERFDELEALGREAELEPSDNPFLLAGLAATRGSEEALRVARRLSNADQRTQVLAVASDLLLQLRRYATSADLIRATAQGSPRAAQLLGRAEMVSSIRPFDVDPPAPDTPEGFVLQLIHANTVSSHDEIAQLYAEYLPEAVVEVEVSALRQSSWIARQALIRNSNLPLANVDFTWHGSRLSLDGDREEGYKAQLRGIFTNLRERGFFVATEDGFRLVTQSDNTALLAAQALHELEQGHAELALTWVRRALDLVPDMGENELPLPFFSPLISDESIAHPDLVRAAISGLLCLSLETAELALQQIEKTGSPPAGVDAETYLLHVKLTRALALAHSRQDQEALDLLAELHAQYPKSVTLSTAQLAMLLHQRKWTEARQVIDARLERDDKDAYNLLALAEWHSVQGHAEAAETIYQRLLDRRSVEDSLTSAADALYYNHLAWGRLYQGRVDEQALDYAQKAVDLTQQQDYATLHTLAAVAAESGRLHNAREILHHAMTVGGHAEPDASDWFVFGQIAEALGLKAEAIEIYERVEPDELLPMDSPQSSHSMAQARIERLRAGENERSSDNEESDEN